MTDLFSLFTKDADRVMANAQRIARKNGYQAITSEGVLLSLLQLSGSQAEATLQALKVRPEAIKTRLQASVKLNAPQTGPDFEVGYKDRRRTLSREATQVVEAAVAEAAENGLDFVDTRLLILGMLRRPNSLGGQILGQYGLTGDDFRAAAKLHESDPVNAPRIQPKDRALVKSLFPVQLSPIFLLLLVFTGVSGYLAYAGIGNSRRTVFLFVTGGWLISLALHEFGHALVGYWGGDISVIDKGYLTLNPLRYTHPLLSIVLPMVFLLLGGIGLPGGAVYINRLAIRKLFMHSLVSAAGPIATLLCGIGLVIPFALGLHLETLDSHRVFWAGLAFLAALQVIALMLNLLPIPGLDGFGIIEPFMPPNILQMADMIRPYSLILIFFVLLRIEAISNQFWQGVLSVLIFLNRDVAGLWFEGFELFRFWTG